MLAGPINLLQSNPLADTKTSIKSWQLGQLLQALALSPNRQGRIELQIGQQRLPAQITTRQNIEAGEKLIVELIKNTEQPVFRIVEQKAPDTGKAALTQLLRQALPKAELTGFLNKLPSLLVAEKQTASYNLPKPVVQQLRQLLMVLPEGKSLKTGEGLKQALTQSGTFMEAGLKKTITDPDGPPIGRQAPGQDFKANLLRLLKLIDSSLPGQRQNQGLRTQQFVTEKQTPLVKPQQNMTAGKPQLPAQDLPRLFELRQLLDAAIAKVQLNQGNTLVNQEQSLPQWIIDLPFKDAGQTALMQIRIRQEQASGRNEKNSARWQLSLCFELDGLGTIGVRVIYLNEQISSSIWADKEASFKAFLDNLPELRRGLQQAGLKIDSLECHHGTLVLDEKTEHSGQSLLSISL